MRPDIDAGPIGRKCRASNGPEAGGLTGAACSARPVSSDWAVIASDSNGEGDQA